MKLLSLVPYTFLPARMGGQKAIEQLYRSLGTLTTVTVVSTQQNDAAEAKHFTLIRLFGKSVLRYANPRYLRGLNGIISQQGITHLFIEHPYMGWMGIYLKKKHHIPLILHAHNIESMRFKSIGKPWWKLLWHYEKYVCRAADFVFFITEEDKAYAIRQYGLPPHKARVALYGTDVAQSPARDDRGAAKTKVCRALNVDETTHLLFFNGTFGYQPNDTALAVLMEHIVPLLQQAGFPFALVVCGKNIPAHWKNANVANVFFLDFVEDIFLYNLAADVFVNPVTEGGGIKTKLVEALAAGANAVSAESGAAGINAAWCNGKLRIVPDGDWQLFAEHIVAAAEDISEMPAIFYEKFSIHAIAKTILHTIR